jgi:hypothetical protein
MKSLEILANDDHGKSVKRQAGDTRQEQEVKTSIKTNNANTKLHNTNSVRLCRTAESRTDKYLQDDTNSCSTHSQKISANKRFTNSTNSSVCSDRSDSKESDCSELTSQSNGVFVSSSGNESYNDSPRNAIKPRIPACFVNEIEEIMTMKPTVNNSTTTINAHSEITASRTLTSVTTSKKFTSPTESLPYSCDRMAVIRGCRSGLLHAAVSMSRAERRRQLTMLVDNNMAILRLRKQMTSSNHRRSLT